MDTAPVPAFPLLPTVVQFRELEQEIPVRSTALLGTICELHRSPSSVVPITYVFESKLVPTAIQEVSIGHEIEFSSAPNGIEVGAVHAGGLIQGLLLLRVVATPPDETPEATQFVVVAQEMDVSEDTDG